MNANATKSIVFGGALLALALASTDASAITREEVLVRARSYAGHKWSSGTANMTATCSAKYVSLYQPGDYVGVAYNWGGYQTLAEFDGYIAAGWAAGAQSPDGVLDCTAGVDCSGFVSKAWNTGHFTTSSLDQTSSQIAQTDMLPADVYNKAGYHVAMQAATKANGEPLLIEAYGYNVNVNSTGGLSHVAGYLPRRYTSISGTTVTDPEGTTTKPIVIGSFPYTDNRNTKLSPSSVLDACASAPGIQERGPEYVYLAKITQPGTLTVTVQDDATTDIDVEILAGNPSPSRCSARNDSTVSLSVGCGDYYIVADTFGANATNAGAYTLNATFTPSGQGCAAVAGPPAFNPKGKLGDACAYPGNKNLPFCNSNLGGDTCIYGQTDSFCSIPCAGNADCGGLGAGSCCQDLGQGEKYCLKQAFCGGNGVQTGTKPSGGDPSGTSSGGTSGQPGVPGDPGDPTADPSADPTAAPAGSTTTTTGGCNTAGTSRAPWELALGALGLGMFLRGRRRSRR